MYCSIFAIVNNHFAVVITVTMTLICLVNTIAGNTVIRSTYGRNHSQIEEMQAINTYFKEHRLQDKAVMYIALSSREPEDKVYDTYFDGSKNYETTAADFYQSLMGNKEKKISDANLPEGMYGSEYKMETIDYMILCTKEAYLMEFMDDMELIPEISGDHYRVYRNLKPEMIARKDPEKIVYDLTQGGYNAYFGIQGLGTCEGDYTWTDGNPLKFEGYLPEQTAEALVTVELETTYNGVQEVALYQYESEEDSVFVKGKDSFSFRISVNHGNYSFEFRFPRKDEKAIGLKSITIEPVTAEE